MAHKPDFFIIGAPKCGTTSLWTWLVSHPNIFMPPEKEPHYFNTDDARRGVTSLEQFEALFRDVREEHRAVGEASVWYLSSRTAVRNILQYQPNARFIVMVRNPIEMAPALHGQMLLAGLENVLDFGKAWHLQESRRRGQCLPAFTWAQRRFLYGEACSLGAQVERLLSMAPSDQVLTLVLDDVRTDPRMEYLRVLDFLRVPDDGRLNFSIHNPAKALKAPVLRYLYSLVALKRAAGIEWDFGLWTRIQMANQIEQPRTRLSPEMIDILRKFFRSDVKLLGLLLRRDLSGWLA
jgi:hypothetical protein